MNDFFLLIDDERVYKNIEHTARTAQEGRRALLSFPVTHLLLDNDLGVESDMEGHQILTWGFERGCIPSKVLIVSNNTPAVTRIGQELQSHGYNYRHRDGWWIKDENDEW